MNDIITMHSTAHALCKITHIKSAIAWVVLPPIWALTILFDPTALKTVKFWPCNQYHVPYL